MGGHGQTLPTIAFIPMRETRTRKAEPYPEQQVIAVRLKRTVFSIGFGYLRALRCCESRAMVHMKPLPGLHMRSW